MKFFLKILSYTIIFLSFGCFIYLFFSKNFKVLFSILSIPFIAFFSLFFHELGHVFAALKNKVKITKVSVYPFLFPAGVEQFHIGGYCKFETSNVKKAIAIYLFGIIFTLVFLSLSVFSFVFKQSLIHIFTLIINFLIFCSNLFSPNSDLKAILRLSK